MSYLTQSDPLSRTHVSVFSRQGSQVGNYSARDENITREVVIDLEYGVKESHGVNRDIALEDVIDLEYGAEETNMVSRETSPVRLS